MPEQTEQNIEIAKRGYDAFSSGDMETVMSLIDDDIDWVQPGESAISGTYHGKGELSELLRRMAEKGTTVRPLRFFADGDTVVVLSEGTVGGETAREVDVLTIRDGKTVRAEACTDTALMERVYGKKQVATG
ncbi:MAG TPA: nuclear transport factor 2 family protein [Mycobacterium sp.]|nr:nuclear transport factor 2 family protein [Mycobacterium sp.]